MAETLFTPGRLLAYDDAVERQPVVRRAADDAVVCIVDGDNTPDGTPLFEEADLWALARLFAASPDLYVTGSALADAAKRVRDLLDHVVSVTGYATTDERAHEELEAHNANFEAAHRKHLAALAKARGHQHKGQS